MTFSCDFHLHSCLSPCGDDAATPTLVAGMCAVNGVEVCALTDHNSMKNCPAFLKACENYNILGLPGMELTTKEEVHVVVLFPDLDGAWGFQRLVEEGLRALPRNDPAVFGRQLVMDEEDRLVEEEPLLLAGATDIGVYAVSALAARFGGLAIPAHIDRPSFSLLANLGLWDGSMGFPCAEVSPACPPDFFARPDLRGVPHITGSDAHYLHQIAPARQTLDLSDRSPSAVLDKLRHLNL